MSGRSGETPFERAFHWARTFDLIKLAPVAEYMIGIGVPVTVQGEVIRISGKLAYEILDNGCCNWDSDFKSMADALYRYICLL